MIHQRKIIKAIAYAILLCFTSLTGAQPLYAIPANTQLPTGPGTNGYGDVTHGDASISVTGNTMNIEQSTNTSVIQWDNFSIGADAAVNFVGKGQDNFNGFNSLNYVMNGPVSEIYGQLTALGGNIFIANPAGVQIGNSAQINVGSLYVTNKDVGSALDGIDEGSTKEQIIGAIQGQSVAATNAELMSLGSIISTNNNVTFDGNRIVIDSDRLYKDTDGTPMVVKKDNGGLSIEGLTIKTNDSSTDDVVLGYTAYTTDFDAVEGEPSASSSTYADKQKTFTLADNTQIKGYMWVDDLFQLQDMNTKLDGWYALRNSIDANYTANDSYGSGIDGYTGTGFAPIGNSTNSFTGRFDGLGYDIFGLTINGTGNNTGLFGYAQNAAIRNVTINSGTITGGDNTGAAVGYAKNSTIENVTNTANVTGENQTGGVVGHAEGVTMSGLRNVGTIRHKDADGQTSESLMDLGGIVGKMSDGSTLGGMTYNLGGVYGGGSSYNVGGIAGSVKNSSIGDAADDAFQIYNQLNVTGGYNVGGIAGRLTTTGNGKSSVTNAANHGTITADGKTADTYSYHTAETQNNTGGIEGTKIENGLASVTVDAANLGGIAGKADGATITDVLNDGDVSSSLATGEDYRIAGNVGGVVGRAENTAITNATNRENSVAGAHNIGGIAGLLANSGIADSENDGGDITGTGARKDGVAVKERVRPKAGDNIENANETFIVGNIGGIAGYMYDSDSTENGEKAEAFVENSTNRGTVHSAYITDTMIEEAQENGGNLPDIVKAANVGGVVGKVDSALQLSASENEANSIMPEDPNAPSNESDFQNVSIRHSYNTGDVQGYTGVGGVAGMMYNGSAARSFNTGKITSTRQSNTNTKEPLNMGGIVGDTTELTDARTVLYDVYNSGQIGDEDFFYYGRHVGGIVGRLSGEIYKAYNTGDIYNGFSVTGGIVGWWHEGDITNVFNTGNITGLNNNNTTGSYVGGIAGAADATTNGGDKTLSYAYNLGTIRSFARDDIKRDNEREGYGNYVSGIIGAIEDEQREVSINNVYTLGNIYAAIGNDRDGYHRADKNNQNASQDDANNPIANYINAVWNRASWGNDGKNVNIENVYYITPEDEDLFKNLKDNVTFGGRTQFNDWIEFGSRNKKEFYSYNDGKTPMAIEKPNTSVVNGQTDDILEDGSIPWRLYGDTPILNVFLPYAEDLFSGKVNGKENYQLPSGVTSVQYGTAYNPLLTIINTDNDITLDWNDMQTTGAAGLAVYGGGLTLDDFQANGEHYFGGTIYAEGGLTVNAVGGGPFVLHDGAKLYGSSVTVKTNGQDAEIIGTIAATGERGGGDVAITSGEDENEQPKDAFFEILGSISSALKEAFDGGGSLTVEGVGKDANKNYGWSAKPTDENGNEQEWSDLLKDPKFTGLPTYGEMYSKTIPPDNNITGDVEITTGGSAYVRYGNMEAGQINTFGNLSINAQEGIYLDTLLHVGGNMELTSDGEIMLDFTSAEGDAQINHLHSHFLDHFSANANGDGNIILDGEGEFKVMVNMWDYDEKTESWGYNWSKFDIKDDHTFEADLDKLNVKEYGENGALVTHFTADKSVYAWVEDAEQLNGIQKYYEKESAENLSTNVLRYNFALRNDIDASGINGFKPIGSKAEGSNEEEGFSGTFDGRGFRILGLNVGTDGETNTTNNAGLFSKLTTAAGNKTYTGTVRDLGIYASTFYGNITAGAVAGVNDGGTISDVTTLGNHVEAKGGGDVVGGASGVTGAAGGIAGVNSGTIVGIVTTGTVAAGGDGVTAGGVAGVNSGLIGVAFDGDERPDEYTTSVVVSNSDVTTATNGAHSLGGVVGVNMADGTVTLADSMGVTNARAGFENDGVTPIFHAEKNTGGIAGVNDGTMISLYNESVVMGKNYVGGVAGTNSGKIENAINAKDVEADTAVNDEEVDSGYAGGLVGYNSGTIDSGRNAGTITGGKNVGGMVGANAVVKDAYGNVTNTGSLKNLSNALAALIFGEKNVGGIAGTNDGAILNEDNLVNEGRVSGNQFVGGIAGVNSGTIENVKSDTLVLDADGNNPTYFGGIAGRNDGTITNATNDSSVEAEGATFVGGIVGENTTIGKLIGEFVNNGSVLGGSSVGGLVGENSNESLLVGATDEQTGEITRLTVTNNGTVEATDGTAAGIVYEHKGKIENADLTNAGEVKGNTGGTAGGGTEHGSGGLFGIVKESSIISDAALINRGTVTATEGGTSSTGGVIGINHGKITNSTLINEKADGEGGVVKGGENTGGLIGKNTGDITYSSLINRVGAEVSGTENVGGLIGYNTGRIEGGRKNANDEDLGMYVNKIYNNGTVSGESNVGGLIGYNAVEDSKSGYLYAAYNTGEVSGTTNIGGIVGKNAAEVSSVFNTIMTGLNEDGTTKYGAVTGKTNVGGIVGSNIGKLTNAYNDTSTVKATGTGGKAGNAVGSNSGTIKNVYATNKTGILIGENTNTAENAVTNAYTFAANDSSSSTITGEAQKQSGSYVGFDFEDTADKEAVWKNYDGWTTPLLKVFLTEAAYDSSKESFTYAAKEWSASAEHVKTADDTAYKNVNSLLSATTGNMDAGEYMAFYSYQIAASDTGGDFNPNNLGYDIDATYTIKQAPLKITLKDIYRVYGDGTMYADEDRTQGISYSDAFSYEGDGIRLNSDMLKELGDGNVYIEGNVTDKAVEGVSGEQETNDAGDYLWSVIVKLADGIKKNYTFGAGEDDDSITVKGDGLSHVAKADLEVTLSDIERIYGNASITQGTYAVESDTLTNGDSGLKITDGVVITDNGLLSSEMTKDANNNTEPYYIWYVENTLNSFDGVKNLSNNYNLTLVNPGKSIVMKRALYIDDILGTIQYGSTGDFNLENGVGFKGIDEENMTGLLEGDSVSITVDDIVAREDGEYELNRTNGGNRATADVKWTNGEIDVYKDSLKALVMLSGDDKKNYYLADANENGQATVNGDIKVTPQELYVTLDKVVRDYGNKDIKEGGYTVTDSFIQSLVNGDAFSKEDIVLSGIFDGALTGKEHGRVTYDVKEDNYKWYATGIDKEKTPERLYSNYKILIGKDVTGESVLDKAVLTLTPNDATTTYGTAFDENSYSYTLSGVTNDDEENALRTAIGVLEYGNDAAFDGEGGKYTADAATHNNAVYIKNLNEKTLTNYNVAQGDKGAAIITKATLDVALNPVERTYGDTALTDCDYSINTDWLDKLVNGDELMYTGDEISISGIISDKAVIDKYTTNDAGEHSWSAKVNASALAQNYNINEIAIGSSIVNKAKLTVNAGHAETTYGTPFDKNKYYYDLVGVTNGDSESEIKAQIGNVAYDNTAAIEDGGDRVTDNAGVNGVLSILTDLFGIELGNYEIEKVNDGTATVEKADLFITAHDKHTHVGREPEYTGTTLGELELVNGDTLADFSYTFGIEEASMLDEAGHYAGTIAAVVDGQYYYDGTHDWSAHHDVFANYKVNVEAGNLTVVRLMPTIPHYNYSWLYDDAPYGRKWNFRERKAEIYFQDGGMAYDENM